METELEMAARHVRQAERIVIEQERRIQQLERDGHDTTYARSRLKTYSESLAIFGQHRDQLLAERSKSTDC